MKPIMTCLSIDCPERKSVCCGAISMNVSGDEGTGHFACSKCGKEFIGGKCNAYKNITITSFGKDTKYDY